jgi:hypothetical protein
MACPLLQDLKLPILICLLQENASANPSTVVNTPTLGVSPIGQAVALGSASRAMGSLPASAGMMAVAAIAQGSDVFDTDDEFTWSGVNLGVDYDTSKPTNDALYVFLSCNHACIQPTEEVIALLSSIHLLIQSMPKSSIGITLMGHVMVTDLCATDHMIPNKSSFISHQSISHLHICMGNNSYIPVLGHGKAIFS